MRGMLKAEFIPLQWRISFETGIGKQLKRVRGSGEVRQLSELLLIRRALELMARYGELDGLQIKK